MSAEENSSIFHFYTRMHLSELTGVFASNLRELLMCIKSVNGSCIYHHTHRFLQQHEYLNPEPANDFAYWVEETLGEKRLAEDLASIDTVSFKSIKALREKLVSVIEDYIENGYDSGRKAKAGMEFYFIKTISMIFPTQYTASNGEEFINCIENITADSIYFHMFESRLRLDRQENDFSWWLRNSAGCTAAADAISRLDPYTHTVEQLKKALIAAVKDRGCA